MVLLEGKAKEGRRILKSLQAIVNARADLDADKVLDEVEAFGQRLASIDPDVQLCVLDYFPAFRRQSLRRPAPAEMLRVKRNLEGAGLRTVVAQTAVGYLGPR